MARNILLITSDQQHWNTLSCLGSPVKTPNLDRLREKGCLFDRAYCPNPTCTPTRSSIITGQYPSQHGAWSLGTKLLEEVPTIGDHLHEAGFATGLIGKAHFQPLRGTDEFPSLESYPTLQDLDFWREFEGPFYGFREFELARNHADEAHVGQHYAIWMENKGFQDWRSHFLPPTGTASPDRKRVWSIPEEYHYNTWIAERSLAFLNRHKDESRPFFLWSSFFDPHPDYLVPEPWASMYDPELIEVPEMRVGEHAANPPHFKATQEEAPDFSDYCESGFAIHGMHSHLHDQRELAKDIAVYYGMVSMMDHAIGKILDGLEERGLAEDTLIVFTTDHGHLFGQHGLIAKGPFMYEDLLKVPMIACASGEIPSGSRTSSLQSLVDLAPTFLAATKQQTMRWAAGVDQWAVWKGETRSARSEVTAEHHHEPTSIHAKTFIDERYKLTVYLDRDYGELFDLEDDPGEVKNLWAEQDAEKLKTELTRKLLFAEMRKEIMPMPRIADA